MLDGKKVVAYIPVRGGSKGIPRKNLYRLGKDTLLERAIKHARLSPWVDQVLVSTDDPEMYQIAKNYDVAEPELRPAHLANDTARTIDVVLHSMQVNELDDAYVLLMQVNSPLRTLADTDALFKEFSRRLGLADAIVSLVVHDEPHPNKIQTLEGGYVTSYIPGDPSVSRQSLPKVYRFNGAYYLTQASIIRDQRTFLPKRTIPFFMPPERSVNLDGKLDLILLEAMIERGLVDLEEY